MELAELQRRLAQAYTDPNASAVLADADQLRAFSLSLRRKRAAIVRRILPPTSAALGDRFDVLFADYSRTSDLRGTRPHVDDALAFCRFVQCPAARYEAAWLEARRMGRRLSVRLFWRPRPSIALWLRLTSNGRLRQFELGRQAVTFGE